MGEPLSSHGNTLPAPPKSPFGTRRGLRPTRNTYFHASFIRLSGVTVSISRFYFVKLFYRQKRMNIHFRLTPEACGMYVYDI